jgi:hypothetical protein
MVRLEPRVLLELLEILVLQELLELLAWTDQQVRLGFKDRMELLEQRVFLEETARLVQLELLEPLV